jgi:hypothetical protein
MRRLSGRTSWRRWALAAAVLGLAPPRSRAAESAPPPPSQAAPAGSLDALDRAIRRCEVLLARDDDPDHRASAQAELDGLRQRRDALRRDFDAAKAADLRVELNLEYQRLAAWIASPRP